MKRLFQLPAAITLFLLCACAFSSCVDQVDDATNDDYLGYNLNLTKPDGAALTLLQGNVEIVVPEGAVSSPVSFTAKQCDNPDECHYLLKMVKIEPLVSFVKPVIVKLKYNGCLSNGYVLPKECTPVISFWETEEDYFKGVEPLFVPCFRDTEGATLNFSVMQTGIFAVGNNLAGVTY